MTDQRSTSTAKSGGSALHSFILAALLLTLAFVVLLEITIVNELWIATMIASFFYPASMFGTGIHFGRKDPPRRGGRFDTGLKYHVATYVIVTLIHVAFMLIRHPEELSRSLAGMFFWGVVVILHVLGDRWIRKHPPSRMERFQ